MQLDLSTPINELHRFGVARLSSLMSKRLATSVASHSSKSNADDATVADLLAYFPMRYEDRSDLLPPNKLQPGLEASVELFVNISGGYRVGKDRSTKKPPLFIFEISATDANRTAKPVVVWWFLSGKAAEPIINSYTELFARGTRFIAYGKWEWDGRRNTYSLKINKLDELEILPDLNRANIDKLLGFDSEDDDDAGDPELATIHTARKVPVYRKLGNFASKRLREIMFGVIEKLDGISVPDELPESLITNSGLISRIQALKEIHFPPDDQSISLYETFRSRAHRRLIFEEFFRLTAALEIKRGGRLKEGRQNHYEFSNRFFSMLTSLPAFDLTSAQQRVVDEILSDLGSDFPMNRLIQGDVGSGKTIVAFLAMLAAIENGYQAALMAPTEILAEQHYRNASAFFEAAGYKVAKLSGSMKAAEKRSSLAAIASGEANIVVGTHAIIQEAVKFNRLALAVIDEQHRFGVLQRAHLRELGNEPDVLVMTATPIPRSLAMIVYGDLEVSIIDELPPGRTPVKTVVCGEDQRKGVYKGIRREIELGRQVYIVYPLIEESEKLDLKAATKMFEELRDKIFPDLAVGIIHGKLKSAEKESVMNDFISGNLNILVSTTVIEVGVDVPNASLMVIEHAERFGLSQLHQLRGRVGRGTEQSYCVLLTGDKKTVTAKERLGIMEETGDGFKIAEKDLDIRGEGEIFGTRQAGLQTFKLANIVRDHEILIEAKQMVDHFLIKNPLKAETAKLIRSITEDPKFDLLEIG